MLMIVHHHQLISRLQFSVTFAFNIKTSTVAYIVGYKTKLFIYILQKLDI